MKRRQSDNGVGRGRYLRRRLVLGQPVEVGGELRMQVTVRMPPDLFENVATYSQREQCSISDTVCDLIEWGFERSQRRRRALSSR